MSTIGNPDQLYSEQLKILPEMNYACVNNH